MGEAAQSLIDRPLLLTPSSSYQVVGSPLVTDRIPPSLRVPPPLSGAAGAGHIEASIILPSPIHPVLFVPLPHAKQELREAGYLEAAIIGQVLGQGSVEVAGGVRQGGPARCISIKKQP